MNIIHENSQQGDDGQTFLPHQLEQDYLSCLLGTDDVDGNETKSTSPGNGSMAGQDDENKNKDTETSKVEVSNKTQREEQYLSVEDLSVSPPFVCQLMLIAGVKFAVPLANFSRVITLPENLDVNTNGTSACVAKFTWQEETMFLLTLEQIMQPEQTMQNDVFNENDKIVLVENNNFGFVCNQMLETVTVSPEDVLWRDESSQRYWLAGTVKQAGFAILDVKGILRSAMGR